MNYMRLLKLLYVAERETIAEAGAAMIGGPAVAMERGPVLEAVYSLIRDQHFMGAEWSKFFHRDRYHLVMHSDPGMGCLTRFITQKLDDVAKRHEDDDEWAMVAFTHHQIPEWIKNNPGTSSKPIPLADILEAMDASDDLDEIIAQDEERSRIAQFVHE